MHIKLYQCLKSLPKLRVLTAVFNFSSAPTRITGEHASPDTSSWNHLRKRKNLLVDKTPFLKTLMKNMVPEIAFRARRFGKTMILTMAEYFFGITVSPEMLEEKRKVFSECLIGKDTDFIKKHCSQYPVILLSLKVTIINMSFLLLFFTGIKLLICFILLM